MVSVSAGGYGGAWNGNRTVFKTLDPGIAYIPTST